ncbi:GAF domain-containing protein [Patulibacter minatonensis]|uniref:GAF domain-containing protein n=1 Tax=Patulibacter minatonensis TaxID=298163 RepID=UPI0006882D37|nr:GAF domain-containing protein [Patulibacter minatonensis]
MGSQITAPHHQVQASPDGPAPSPTDPRTADLYGEAIAAFGDVSEALSELHELDDLLHLIARKICELVGVRRCSLYLRDERSSLYRGQVGHWLHDIDEGVKRLTSGGAGDAFTREIVATKAPVVVQDTRSDTRPIKSTMRSWDVRSMLGVPMVLRGDVVGIVYLDDADQRRQYTAADEAIASMFANLAAIAIQQARLTSDLRAKLTTVATQNASMRRAAVVDDRLTALVLEGSNMREIATAIAELTGKACAIHDAEFRQIAVGRPAGDDDGMLPKLLSADTRSHPDVRRALAGLRDNRPGVVGPMPYAGVHNRCIVAPVAAGTDQWGHLLLLEHGSRLTNFDMLVARRGATVIAWGMSAERRAAAAEWNVGASLAGELIRGNRDISALERRAEHVGIRIDDPHALCLITTATDSGTIVPDARAVADAFAPEGEGEPRPLATAVTEGVGVIVPLPSDDAKGLEAVKARVTAACAALDADGALIAGISTVCRQPADYVRAYEQAIQVVRCLNTFSAADHSQVLAANDLGAGRLFLSTSNAAEADRFVQETLGKLLTDKSRADLLTTLHVFCRHGRSVRRTSQVMGVHENTIRYRIMRAETLTELDVTNDSDAQFSVQLALLILRLKGVLPWEAGVEEPDAG